MPNQSETGIWSVFKRESKRIATSKICIWAIFVAPLISLLILVSMMGEGLPTKIPIAVVDLDNTKTTRSLVRQLDAFPKTDIKFKSLSFTEARMKMERAEIYAVLVIPREFSRKAVSGGRPKLTFYTNNSFLISGSFLFQDLKTISILASASVNLQLGSAKGYSKTQIMPIVQPITVEAHPIGNPWMNYSIYLNNLVLPAIMQLMIIMLTISCFGSEVKSGSARLLMKMGNDSITKVLIGKMLPYTICFTVLALFFMSVFYYYNHFPMRSGFFPMFLNYICLILGSQGFGLILLGVFQHYRFSLSIASLVGSLSFSVVGFSFPILAMHPTLQSLTLIYPLRHFFMVYVDQALNALPMGYSAGQYAAMLSFLLVSFLLVPRIKQFLMRNTYEE